MKDSGRLPQTKPCPPLKTRMIADGLREQFPARGLYSRDKQHFVSHHPRLYNGWFHVLCGWELSWICCQIQQATSETRFWYRNETFSSQAAAPLEIPAVGVPTCEARLRVIALFDRHVDGPHLVRWRGHHGTQEKCSLTRILTSL